MRWDTVQHLPEVTMVHPRADGELPAVICESSACAPGSAIGPPSMTTCSKRTMASLFFFLVTAARMANEQTGVWVVGFPSGRVGE